MSFYNTINLKLEDLKRAQVKAKYQKDRILLIMETLGGKFTPYEVQIIYNNWWPQTALITSIRRSMTNLTKEDKLEKLEVMKEERYGKPNHYWVIKTKKS